MQKEYKESVQRIALSDSDRERILAHVKSEYEKNSLPAPPIRHYRRRLAAAAVLALICVGAGLAAGQLLVKNNSGNSDVSGGFLAKTEEEPEWEQLDSVQDISEKTDCSTYMLKKAPDRYEVKKVEVARGKKHVRITYKDRKADDKLLFEYAEKENASEIQDQFDGQNKLKTGKVGKLRVTMYGEKDCNAMMWEEDGCTFALTLSRPRSCQDAMRIAFGGEAEKEEKPKEDKQHPKEEVVQKVTIDPEEETLGVAPGWMGDEETTPPEERDSLLGLFYEENGFQVLLEQPASEVTYKSMDSCESFSFYCSEFPFWEDCLLIGYAARDELPYELTKDFYSVETELLSDGTFVKIHENDEGRVMFTFRKDCPMNL